MCNVFDKLDIYVLVMACLNIISSSLIIYASMKIYHPIISNNSSDSTNYTSYINLLDSEIAKNKNSTFNNNTIFSNQNEIEYIHIYSNNGSKESDNIIIKNNRRLYIPAYISFGLIIMLLFSFIVKEGDKFCDKSFFKGGCGSLLGVLVLIILFLAVLIIRIISIFLGKPGTRIFAFFFLIIFNILYIIFVLIENKKYVVYKFVVFIEIAAGISLFLNSIGFIWTILDLCILGTNKKDSVNDEKTINNSNAQIENDNNEIIRVNNKVESINNDKSQDKNKEAFNKYSLEKSKTNIKEPQNDNTNASDIQNLEINNVNVSYQNNQNSGYDNDNGK